jgi:hypothetical protein
MSTINDVPTENKFPGNTSNATSAEKETYFNNVFGKLIDEFVFQKNTNSGANEMFKLCIVPYFSHHPHITTEGYSSRGRW